MLYCLLAQAEEALDGRMSQHHQSDLPGPDLAGNGKMKQKKMKLVAELVAELLVLELVAELVAELPQQKKMTQKMKMKQE